ncbi:MAG: cation-efflux pump [Anaerolineales bacterium]
MANLQSAERSEGVGEKRTVALMSVFAAVFLTCMKLVVGILTGSLGILSEAAHSGLDLIAAVVTFLAVRVSALPPSQRYTYGHGKVENLSALVEALLLLVTCGWILYEAVTRLFFKAVPIEVNLWAFLVMAASILIDFSRSRALGRVAKRYASQALEADALHFATDIWSSSVVLLGLVLVLVAERTGIGALAKADALAALGVASIVIYVGVQMGRRTVFALLDGVSPSLRDELERAVKVPGVMAVRRVRVRRSGPESFADLQLAIPRDVSLERAHEIARQAEGAVREVLPGSDVVVELLPGRSEDEQTVTTVRTLAARFGMGAHSIRIYDTGGSRSLELHLEVSDRLSVEEAHLQATEFEQAIHRSLPYLERVITHLEPAGDSTSIRQAAPEEQSVVVQALREVLEKGDVRCHPHDIEVHRVGAELALSFHCILDSGESIADAHQFTESVERNLRRKVPAVGRVTIHVEPAQPAES